MVNNVHQFATFLPSSWSQLVSSIVCLTEMAFLLSAQQPRSSRIVETRILSWVATFLARGCWLVCTCSQDELPVLPWECIECIGHGIMDVLWCKLCRLILQAWNGLEWLGHVWDLFCVMRSVCGPLAWHVQSLKSWRTFRPSAKTMDSKAFWDELTIS